MGGSERECLRMINSPFAMVVTFIKVSISWWVQLEFFFPQKYKIASIILLSKRDLPSGSMAFFVGGMRGWL